MNILFSNKFVYLKLKYNFVKNIFMTDRVKGFTVTLEKDFRIDDVEGIKNAISMIKGVAHVEESITNIDDHMNREMVVFDIKKKFYENLDNIFK